MANIFKRISDVITANINDLIDRVEDPERMIKQIIREMEENISKAKGGVIDAIASEKQLQKELEHNRQQSAEWLSKAEQALQAEKEDLARAALIRKREHDSIIKAIEPSWVAARNTSEQLKAQLRALEAKLEEARRKRSTLIGRQRAAEARQQMDKTMTSFQAGLNAQASFARMEDKVAEIESRTEAMAELNGDASDLEKEFLAMEVEHEVENELDRLKKKIQG
ncbi:PspA/IM30 family protein [Desulforhabdus sp. TSK]|uniref:PspA/IM30 family protein n=1 Tax=Desulforhabdus sp. TSK TaxID=2925014 RepID=UPI001FC7C9AC|nr:PspA/IM30 family protein [Desulforhabdus sp. TSK]GKT09388.1 phage shock protein A [Desulforhabdus sp. TSK]